jgi:hypothetical protein
LSQPDLIAGEHETAVVGSGDVTGVTHTIAGSCWYSQIFASEHRQYRRSGTLERLIVFGLHGNAEIALAINGRITPGKVTHAQAFIL